MTREEAFRLATDEIRTFRQGDEWVIRNTDPDGRAYQTMSRRDQHAAFAKMREQRVARAVLYLTEDKDAAWDAMFTYADDSKHAAEIGDPAPDWKTFVREYVDAYMDTTDAFGEAR
jgi:hypothetical protein